MWLDRQIIEGRCVEEEDDSRDDNDAKVHKRQKRKKKTQLNSYLDMYNQ